MSELNFTFKYVGNIFLKFYKKSLFIEVPFHSFLTEYSDVPISFLVTSVVDLFWKTFMWVVYKGAVTFCLDYGSGSVYSEVILIDVFECVYGKSSHSFL